MKSHVWAAAVEAHAGGSAEGPSKVWILLFRACKQLRRHPETFWRPQCWERRSPGGCPMAEGLRCGGIRKRQVSASQKIPVKSEILPGWHPRCPVPSPMPQTPSSKVEGSVKTSAAHVWAPWCAAARAAGCSVPRAGMPARPAASSMPPVQGCSSSRGGQNSCGCPNARQVPPTQAGALNTGGVLPSWTAAPSPRLVPHLMSVSPSQGYVRLRPVPLPRGYPSLRGAPP